MAKKFWQDSPVAKFPCKDCPDRHACCHSDCERYLKAKEEQENYNRQEAEARRTKREYFNIRVKRSHWLGHDTNKQL